MRWIFRLLGVVVLLAVMAVGALFLIPTERIANLAAAQFEAATGRDLVFTGDVRPRIWPELGVSSAGLELANADWAGAQPLLKADALTVGVDTAALWGGAIRVKRVELTAPQIRLVRDAQGRGNWELASAPSGTGTPNPTGAEAEAAQRELAVSLERATLTNGLVVFEDRATGAVIKMEDITGSAQLAALDGPAALDLEGLLNGTRVSFKGEVDALATFLSQGITVAKITGAVGGSSLQFDGNAGLTPMAAGGGVALDISDQDAIFALLGAAAPDLPPELKERVTLDGDVTYTDGGITLRNGTVTVGPNRMTGDVDILLSGERPKITARLNVGTMDLSSLMGGSAGSSNGGAAGSSSAGWPKDRIDVSALQAVDADVSLVADALDLGILTLGRTSTRTELVAGRAVTTIRELSAYGGAIGGSFVVNSRGGLSARANLTASQIAVQPLMTQFAGYDRVAASGDLQLNLLGVGDTVDALMRSLEGDLAFAFGKGELLGFDLVGMLKNLDPSYVGAGQSTIFDSLSSSFQVVQGVARSQDLRLDANLLTATGGGAIGLGNQNLDYALAPTLLEGQANGGLTVPVKIAGPWADPRFQLDLEALARQELAEEIEMVKQQAENAVLKKLEEETGIQAESIGQVEDAVKQKVEDAIGNEVGSALKGLLGR